MTEGQAPEQQKKKGLGALAWIGIGCGALIVIILVVLVGGGFFLFGKAKDVVEDFSDNPVAAAAETVVRLSSELELVESDREAGKIIVREVSSGKVLTFDYEDISEGRFSFEGEDGEALRFDASGAADGEATLTIEAEDGTTTLGTGGQAVDLPDWLPSWSGSVAEQGGFSTVTNTERTGTYAFQTEDSADAILAFYREVLEDLDLEVSEAKYSGGGSAVTSLSGKSAEYDVTVSVTDTQTEATTVSLIYKGPAN